MANQTQDLEKGAREVLGVIKRHGVDWVISSRTYNPYLTYGLEHGLYGKSDVDAAQTEHRASKAREALDRVRRHGVDGAPVDREALQYGLEHGLFDKSAVDGAQTEYRASRAREALDRVRRHGDDGEGTVSSALGEPDKVREYATIEALMRPGKLSMGGFLGEDESLHEVLEADDRTVRRLGVTHGKIADRIEHFIYQAMNHPLDGRGRVIDNGKYSVGGLSYRGGQDCPWGDAGHSMEFSHMNLFVINLELNEQLNFPGGIVHLIRKHRFYEGPRSPYRVDPERAVRILGITAL